VYDVPINLTRIFSDDPQPDFLLETPGKCNDLTPQSSLFRPFQLSYGTIVSVFFLCELRRKDREENRATATACDIQSLSQSQNSLIARHPVMGSEKVVTVASGLGSA
jgi:hypothetical protein